MVETTTDGRGSHCRTRHPDHICARARLVWREDRSVACRELWFRRPLYYRLDDHSVADSASVSAARFRNDLLLGTRSKGPGLEMGHARFYRRGSALAPCLFRLPPLPAVL